MSDCLKTETVPCDASKMSGRALASRLIARCRKEVVMSYRYNTIDIIVGVGMCAIVFGALLFFCRCERHLSGSHPTAHFD